MRELIYPNVDFGGRYLINIHGNVYDTKKDKFVKWVEVSKSSYIRVRLRDINNTVQNLLVHRIVAATFIGDIVDMAVHHNDHVRGNPYVENLTIMRPHDHHVFHNAGENNGTAKFTNDDVHKICRMLEAGVTHKKIAKKMSKRTGKKITIDAIDKIACGKNWTRISSLYNITPAKRETMGEFSKKKVLIGKLIAVDGLTIRQTAERLGVEYGTKRYQRFKKCAARYAKEFNSKTKFIFTNL